MNKDQPSGVGGVDAPSSEAEAFKAEMQRLSHDDYPGGNLWQITSVREKSLMLKAWKAARGVDACGEAQQEKRDA